MIELGLQRISRLLAQTSLPWRAIHVAGTNGKGSVCAYISHMLDAYNDSKYRRTSRLRPLKHARYNSPHLIDRWDCITVNQKVVPFTLFDEVEKRVLQRNKDQATGASEFELLTATAFEIFTQEKIDVAVVEVGLGGRLDATNILGLPVEESGLEAQRDRPSPLVTAITKIGLDHQALLGDTLADIASEKAGIIKPGVPVIVDPSNDPDAIEVIERKGKKLNSPIIHAIPAQNFKALEHPSNAHSEHQHMSAHKYQNLCTAMTATWASLQSLDRVTNHWDDLPEDRTDSLKDLASQMWTRAEQSVFSGRQQYVAIDRLVQKPCTILLDGAHNAQSAEALAIEVEKLRTESPLPLTWVIAASDSKDIREMLKLWLRDLDTVVAVEFGSVDGMPWVQPMKTGAILQAVADVGRERSLEIRSHDCGPSVLDALKSASLRAEDGRVVVAGSLYLVGDVLRLLRTAEGNA